MANRRRGEIEATLAGRRRRLCLTLGALAELEDAYRVEDLTALIARFAHGKLAARDLIRILAAGLNGAGETVTEADIAALGGAEGVAALAAVAGELLRVTFATDPVMTAGPDPGHAAGGSPDPGQVAGGSPPDPFPGAR